MSLRLQNSHPASHVAWAGVAALRSSLPLFTSASPAGMPAVEPIAPAEQGFYSKRLLCDGIPVKAHESVPDEALLAGCRTLRTLLEHAPELRRNLLTVGHELHVIGKWQFPSDLPEMRDLRGTRLENGQLFDDHMRGGHIVGRFSSCVEGVLLKYVTDLHFGDETCMHELGHAVQELALTPEVRAKIVQQYHRSLGEGLWAGEYASRNENEFFAELTKYYFTKDGENEFVRPEYGWGREWLRKQDPGGFALVDALYSGRLSPGVVRRGTLMAVSPHPERPLRSVEAKTRVHVTVVNHSNAAFRLLWLDYRGQRDSRRPFDQMALVRPGTEDVVDTFATHPWLAASLDGTPLCAFVPGEEDAVVTIEGACP